MQRTFSGKYYSSKPFGSTQQEVFKVFTLLKMLWTPSLQNDLLGNVLWAIQKLQTTYYSTAYVDEFSSLLPIRLQSFYQPSVLKWSRIKLHAPINLVKDKYMKFISLCNE